SSAARPAVEGGGSAVPGADTASESPAVRQDAAASRASRIFFIRGPRECTTSAGGGFQGCRFFIQGSGRAVGPELLGACAERVLEHRDGPAPRSSASLRSTRRPRTAAS